MFHVRELIALGALDDVVQHQNSAMVARFEDQNVLEFALFVVQDLVNFEAHGLAGPHVGAFMKPAI